MIMWNMSCQKIDDRKELTRFEFLQVVAHQLLHYKTEDLMSPELVPNRAGRFASLHEQLDFEPSPEERHEILQSSGKHRCLVCHLEVCQYRKVIKANKEKISEAMKKTVVDEASKGLRKQVSTCRQCCAYAHTALPTTNKRFIHGMFPGLTCMEILHTRSGKEIWNVNANRHGRTAVRFSHPMVDSLRDLVEDSLLG